MFPKNLANKNQQHSELAEKKISEEIKFQPKKYKRSLKWRIEEKEIYFLYLKGRIKERERGGKIEKSSIIWIIPQMAAKGKAGPGPSHDPGAFLRCCTWAQEIQHLAILCRLQVHFPGSGLEGKLLRLDQILLSQAVALPVFDNTSPRNSFILKLNKIDTLLSQLTK